MSTEIERLKALVLGQFEYGGKIRNEGHPQGTCLKVLVVTLLYCCIDSVTNQQQQHEARIQALV